MGAMGFGDVWMENIFWEYSKVSGAPNLIIQRRLILAGQWY